jgi:protein phosphatase
MGITLTAVLFSGGRAALTHIGDSRTLQLRSGRLRPITENHTIGNLVATSACSRRCSPST